MVEINCRGLRPRNDTSFGLNKCHWVLPRRFAAPVYGSDHQVQRGQRFRGPILEHHRDQFAETLIRKMLAYSLGRYLDFTDTESVEAIQAEFTANDFRMRRLITSIVLSEPFLTK